MNSFAGFFTQLSRILRRRRVNILDRYSWSIRSRARSLMRRLVFSVRVLSSSPELHSQQGKRFLELHYLLKDFLISRIKNNVEHGDHIASQLLNVLRNCDVISYTEEGTAEAYALIHFLNRYHRFQLIFDALSTAGLMPRKSRKIHILDIGTGPGPSMFAVSDYYTSIQEKRTVKNLIHENKLFSINYVERSQEFRNWLHHFTEHVNCDCPSEIPWMVPDHHGTFTDFQGLEFDQHLTYMDQDDEGQTIIRRRVEKFRFDIIVLSNFLTTKEQVKQFSNELKNCVRFLRHNGILIVVGAKGENSRKYREVYEEISNAILSENYNTRKFIADCTKMDFDNSGMSYMWNDSYGKILKELLGDVYQVLQTQNKQTIPSEMAKEMNEVLQPSYAGAIKWEVHVFRKKAKMRFQRKSKPNAKSA